MSFDRKEYNKQNREKTKKQVKEWRRNNLERSKKTSSEYYRKNKKMILEKIHKWREENPNYPKEWYQKNKEQQKLKCKKYREKNKDKINENLIKWRKENPEMWKAIHSKSLKKYRKKNPEKIKAQNLAQKIKIPMGQLCEICNKELATERHHEDYNKPKKVKLLCRKCHIELHKLKQILICMEKNK